MQAGKPICHEEILREQLLQVLKGWEEEWKEVSEGSRPPLEATVRSTVLIAH